MNQHFRFRIHTKDRKSSARTGEIHTSRGVIRTPGFVPVGTAATVKSLTPEEIRECRTDIFFVNTYHMLFRPGIQTVLNGGGLHKFMSWEFPLMTDSGGFQVFSLGENGPRNTAMKEEQLVKITDEGAYFKSAWDGTTVFLGPEESIRAQIHLDSDIMMAFDECTFYPITEKRAELAMKRTHRWAKACLEVKRGKHALYGIVQGSVFEKLRKESAGFISSLPFEGFAIGSVANSREPREKVFQVLDWTMPYLYGKNKPVHFLGIGEIEDIFLSIERGVDTLDCVTPTRLARMGWIFDKKAGLAQKFRYDISKKDYTLDGNPPENVCNCYTCKRFTRSYLHHLFKSRELLYYRLSTIHNLTFFGRLMEEIRSAITENRFSELKRDWLGYT